MKNDTICFWKGEPCRSKDLLTHILDEGTKVRSSEIRFDENSSRILDVYVVEGRELFVEHDVTWAHKELLTPAGIRQVREVLEESEPKLVRCRDLDVKLDMRTLLEKLDAPEEVDWGRYNG